MVAANATPSRPALSRAQNPVRAAGLAAHSHHALTAAMQNALTDAASVSMRGSRRIHTSCCQYTGAVVSAPPWGAANRPLHTYGRLHFSSKAGTGPRLPLQTWDEIDRSFFRKALSMCQDVDHHIRISSCLQLSAIARIAGKDVTAKTILPELFELLNDESLEVRGAMRACRGLAAGRGRAPPSLKHGVQAPARVARTSRPTGW